jgi:hypothetical protein
MRGCAKTGCDQPASASVGLRYGERIVVLGDLPVRFDPNLLELCGSHADQLTPPRGWIAEDRRRNPDENLSGPPSAESPGLQDAWEALAPGA